MIFTRLSLEKQCPIVINNQEVIRMQRERKLKIVREYIKLRRLEAEKNLDQIRDIVQSDKDVVNKLIDRKVYDKWSGRRVDIWSKQTAEVWLRAKFHCEYCGKCALASVDNYIDMQIEHIEPKAKGGDKKNIENLALSCQQCNVRIKSRVSFNEMEKIVEDHKP